MTDLKPKPGNLKARIPILDALRGFAIFGILIVNIRSFAFSYDLTPLQVSEYPWVHYDKSASLLINTLLDGKFYSIFSLLFGIGFSIYLSKQLPEKQLLKLFTRRLFFLFILGALHLIVWKHDTLMLYAVLGFFLIPFRKVKNTTILTVAGFCILSPILWDFIEISYPQFHFSQYPQNWGEYLINKAGLSPHSEDDYFSFWKKFDGDLFFRLRVGFYNIFFRTSYILSSYRVWKVFGMFLIGLLIGRSKSHEKLQYHKKLLWTITLCGLLIGVPANYIWAWIGQNHWYIDDAQFKQAIAFSIGVAPLALGYCGIFSLLYLKPVFAKFLNIFSAVGKLALTNYILQTIIGLFVFSNFGLGIHYVGVTQSVAYALLIFAIQISFSNLWLRFFNYGPLEWLWRSVTYKQIQPIYK